MIKSALKFLRSIKLAIVLLVLIALGSGIAGLLPQAPAGGGSMARDLEGLALALGFGTWFHSPVFYALVAVFALNLGVCTAYRLWGQVRKKGRRRFGPDILHLGLLVLIAAAVLGSASKKESSFMMSKGDVVALPDGQTLSLLDFQFQTYSDGRPRAWISTVELGPGPDRPGRSKIIDIEVNHPLRLKGLSIYQSSYATTTAAVMQGPGAARIRLFGGDSASLPELGPVYFMAVEGSQEAPVALLVTESKGERHINRLGLEGRLGNWTLMEIAQVQVTGLRASSDRAYPAILAGFLLLALGLCLTYIQKLKDMKI